MILWKESQTEIKLYFSINKLYKTPLCVKNTFSRNVQINESVKFNPKSLSLFIYLMNEWAASLVKMFMEIVDVHSKFVSTIKTAKRKKNLFFFRGEGSYTCVWGEATSLYMNIINDAFCKTKNTKLLTKIGKESI